MVLLLHIAARIPGIPKRSKMASFTWLAVDADFGWELS